MPPARTATTDGASALSTSSPPPPTTCRSPPSTPLVHRWRRRPLVLPHHAVTTAYFHLAKTFGGGPRSSPDPRGSSAPSTGLHLPTSTSEESLGEVLRELLAGDEHQGRQGGPRDHPRMADGIDQEQPAPGRPRAARQPGGAGLDELLRAVLPLEVRPGPSPPQRGPRSMGATEVQAAATSRARVDAPAGAHRAAGPKVVRPVATRRPTRGWIVGAG